MHALIALTRSISLIVISAIKLYTSSQVLYEHLTSQRTNTRLVRGRTVVASYLGSLLKTRQHALAAPECLNTTPEELARGTQ